MMSEYSEIQKPQLPYVHEFETDQLDSMSDCLAEHGFAVIKNVLNEKTVERLKESVFEGTDPNRDLQIGQSRTRHAWIESGPGAWQMLADEEFMSIHRHLIGTDQLTIHRSASIIRMPNSKPVAWHSDWCGFSNKQPRNSGDVLNRGLWPSGKWFYLTGSQPEHGGLCVIEGSHIEGWGGPNGFRLTGDRRSFYKIGDVERAYTGFDVPGLVPLFTEPGDMIVFAHRTYHAAFPNHTDKIRLSCAIGFRSRQQRIKVPWEMPKAAEKFLNDLPEHLHQYTDGYTSIDNNWRG